MAETIFHKIAAGEVPAYTVLENENYIAFLDIAPQFYGQTVVIPKKETTSKFSEADTELLTGMMEFGQEVARILENKIEGVARCLAVIEGFEIDYLHLKLMPSGPASAEEQVVLTNPVMAPEDELKELHSILTSK